MLTDSQFGFRKGKSCVTNLLSYYDRVAETMQERDGWVDSIYSTAPDLAHPAFRKIRSRGKV